MKVVRVHDEGHILLEELVSEKDVQRIDAYNIKRLEDGTIVLKFYDKDGKLIKDLDLS